MPTYQLTPAAVADLDQIFDYTLMQWGLDKAQEYTDKLLDTCESLADMPTLAQDCSDIRIGYRRMIAQQHAIYFRVEPWGIAIVRILHQQMDRPRHLS